MSFDNEFSPVCFQTTKIDVPVDKDFTPKDLLQLSNRYIWRILVLVYQILFKFLSDNHFIWFYMWEVRFSCVFILKCHNMSKFIADHKFIKYGKKKRRLFKYFP